jgi:hypothetical protein
MLKMAQMEWQNTVTEKLKGMLVTNPGMAPAAVRVDQLDREQVGRIRLLNGFFVEQN